MAASRPQEEEQINTTWPPTSGASWEQYLGDSTIRFPRKMFYKKVYKNNITLRVYSESLDQFLEVYGHQGEAGSSSLQTTPSGSPGRGFRQNFIKTELL